MLSHNIPFGYNKKYYSQSVLRNNEMIDKDSFRQVCLERLKRVKVKKAYKNDKKILSLLVAYIKKHNIQNVFLYVPMGIEVNTYPLIAQLRKEKKQVYVPFMEGKSFRLVKYRLPLRQKRFGIKEPNDSKQFRNKKIDLAIVPIVGTDTTWRRVGFGKGMYDRFFEKEHKNINKVIFVARELCYSKEIVTNHFDIKADMIFTP